MGVKLKKIPELIDFVAPSLEAKCLHEAGHAAAALMAGVAPVRVELVDDPSLPGEARVQMPYGLPESKRQIIASAAYAVETWLFESGRLIDSKGAALSRQAFIKLAGEINAARDKENFHGCVRKDADGMWPDEDDELFVERALSVRVLLNMPLVVELAEALLNEGRLECARIVEIGTKHLPTLKSEWVRA